MLFVSYLSTLVCWFVCSVLGPNRHNGIGLARSNIKAEFSMNRRIRVNAISPFNAFCSCLLQITCKNTTSSSKDLTHQILLRFFHSLGTWKKIFTVIIVWFDRRSTDDGQTPTAHSSLSRCTRYNTYFNFWFCVIGDFIVLKSWNKFKNKK